MADITMCSNDLCKSSGTCYRFLAKANPYGQSYFIWDAIEPIDKCDRYWRANGKSKEETNENSKE